MGIDKAEIATLVEDDFGEMLIYRGTEFTASFALGATEPDDQEAAGDANTIEATASFTTGVVNPAENEHLTRKKDSTEWEIITLNPSDDGMTVAKLQQFKRISVGMM